MVTLQKYHESNTQPKIIIFIWFAQEVVKMVCTRISEEYYTILIIPEKEYDLTVSVAGAGKVQNWV